MPEAVVEKEIKCRDCGKEVEVKIIRFGDGYVAAPCPECGGVAYNSQKLP